MDDEKLISLVQENDILYNKFNKYYRMPDKKKAVWSKIAKEMEVPEEYCVKRWTSLRDRYAKEKKNEKLASGSGATFNHYISQLEFLGPHIASRPVRSTKNIFEETTSVANKGFEVIQHSTPVSQTTFIEAEMLESQYLETQSQDSMYTSPIGTSEQVVEKQQKKKS